MKHGIMAWLGASSKDREARQEKNINRLKDIGNWTRARNADHMKCVDEKTSLRAALKIIRHVHAAPETDFSRWVRQIADQALAGEIFVDTSPEDVL